jgi:hypothetical protein
VSVKVQVFWEMLAQMIIAGGGVMGQIAINIATSGAEAVCRSARHKKPIGPEIDLQGSGLVWHYHQTPRTDAHRFYGPPR